MDTRKIFNNDPVARSPYNKMDEEMQSQNNIHSFNQNKSVNTTASSNRGRGCLWPHQWTLNECCCGCSLRIGCLLIGWFYMIGSSLLLFSFLYLPVPLVYRWEDVIFTGLKLVSSVILLVGTYKDLVRVIRASVVLYTIDVFVEVILAVVLSVQMSEVYPILVLIIGIPLALYFLVSVNSYANDLSARMSLRNSLTANVV